MKQLTNTFLLMASMSPELCLLVSKSNSETHSENYTSAAILLALPSATLICHATMANATMANATTKL